MTRLLHGDCVELLATWPAESVDACVTDPPYELGFMGKAWDSSGIAFNVPVWRAVWRVLKPGAHLVAFGGTRTAHRIGCAIEDAGFEIRDSLAWIYGQGFPKSLNLGEGLGTALKPAHEPIMLARKPCTGTVTANVATHGTGALNIDACRIAGVVTSNPLVRNAGGYEGGLANQGPSGVDCETDIGRWPANVVLDARAARVLDEQSGELVSGSGQRRPHAWQSVNAYGFSERPNGASDYARDRDTGGASRFYYVAKPSRDERDAGIDDRRGNFHPTVKPVALMRWLVRLVTPINGTVIDPFLGSGTTGMACRYEWRHFIGMEREAEYVAIAERRIAAVAPLFAEVSE